MQGDSQLSPCSEQLGLGPLFRDTLTLREETGIKLATFQPTSALSIIKDHKAFCSTKQPFNGSIQTHDMEKVLRV